MVCAKILYSKLILPLVGKRISKHPSAYTYLPTSIEAFPSADAFTGTMRRCGVSDIETKPLTGGIATMYFGKVQKNAFSLQ